MSSGATFDIGLADKVTGVAKLITGSLDSILHSAIAAAGGPEKVEGAMTAASKAAEGLSATLGPVAGVAGQVGGAIVGMAEKSAVAVLALTAVIGGLIVAMASIAVKAGEAKAKLLATFSALAGGAAQGQATLAMVDRLGDSLGMTREELAPFATKLLGAGVAANRLEASLRAVAAANALIEGGGEKVTGILAKLTEQGMKGTKIKFSPAMLVGTGVSEQELMKALGMTPKALELAKKQGKLTGQQLADAIVKVLGQKGSGPLADQANKLTSLWAKFQENVTKLFDAVTSSAGYKEFLAGMKKLLGIFAETSPAAKAMKAGITGAFSAMFSAAAKVLPYIKLGIEKAIIAALKAYIAFKAWRKEGSQLGTLGTILHDIGNASKVAAVYIVGIARAIGVVVSVGSKLYAIGQAIDDGLAKGITAGVGKVTGAIKGLGAAAIAALKSALSIASPSKAFAKLGAYTAAGFQGGITAGSSGVKAASAGMAASAVRGAAGSPGAPAKPDASGGGGKTEFNFAPGAIVIQGATGDVKTLTEVAASAIFERIRVSQGVGA